MKKIIAYLVLGAVFITVPFFLNYENLEFYAGEKKKKFASKFLVPLAIFFCLFTPFFYYKTSEEVEKQCERVREAYEKYNNFYIKRDFLQNNINSDIDYFFCSKNEMQTFLKKEYWENFYSARVFFWAKTIVYTSLQLAVNFLLFKNWNLINQRIKEAICILVGGANLIYITYYSYIFYNLFEKQKIWTALKSLPS